MIIWLNLQSGPSDRTGPDHLRQPRTEERMSHLGVRSGHRPWLLCCHLRQVLKQGETAQTMSDKEHTSAGLKPDLHSASAFRASSLPSSFHPCHCRRRPNARPEVKLCGMQIPRCPRSKSCDVAMVHSNDAFYCLLSTLL